MFFKKVKCVGCGAEWEKAHPNQISEELDRLFPFSHTVCRVCQIAIIRGWQRRQKNFDCFGKAVGYCDQGGCKYREPCLSGS